MFFIPSTITCIDDYAFYRCQSIDDIEFSNDIQLKSFGKSAFAGSSISEINIPLSVIKISSNCFMNCINFDTVNIPEDSKLQIIEKNTFLKSGIKQIFILQNVKEFSFKFDLCNIDINDYNNIEHIEISPENNHFKYIDEEKKIIVGKSNILNNDFDTILFATNDIKKIFIPSNIKFINEGAFFACKQLTEVKFDKNSRLISISAFAFSRTGIIEMIIPSNVKDIGKSCFSHLILEKLILNQIQN